MNVDIKSAYLCYMLYIDQYLINRDKYIHMYKDIYLYIIETDLYYIVYSLYIKNPHNHFIYNGLTIYLKITFNYL